jgi:putative tricarboxylic transport membrane protein
VKIADLLFGIVVALLGAAVLAYAAALPGVPGHYYGPGLFPTIIGWGFVGCGTMLALSGWQRGERLTGLLAFPDWQGAPRGLALVGLMAIAILVFFFFGDMLGFRLIAFLVLAAMYRVGGRSLGFSVAVAALVSLGLNALFVNLLGVPLPVGELPWIGG